LIEINIPPRRAGHHASLAAGEKAEAVLLVASGITIRYTTIRSRPDVVS
jgi:hypothetical protein